MEPLHPALDPGDRLGEFELVHALGQGAFASVWRVRRHGAMGFASDAALKLIPAALLEGHPEIVSMFADEARVLGLLHHPNIADVHWFGRLDSPVGGFFGLAMEWVDGRSLAEAIADARLAGRTMDVGTVRGLLGELCDALDAVHRLMDEHKRPLGLIHRDIKPSNILITAHGHAKLLDFGVARSRFRLADKTATSGLRGTLQYMSPEQAGSRSVDSFTDLWSLGAVAYEALTGRRLVPRLAAGATLEALGAVDPEEVRRSVDDAAPGLGGWVAALLQQEPADRPSAAMALNKLTAAVQTPSAPVRREVTPTVQVRPAVEAPPQRPSRLPLLAVSVALFLGLAAAAVIRPDPPPQTATLDVRSPTPWSIELATPSPTATPRPAVVAASRARAAAPGTLRVGSDLPFELLAAGKSWNLREARRDVLLPAGRQQIRLRCTTCDSPLELTHEVVVRSGETVDVYVPSGRAVP